MPIIFYDGEREDIQSAVHLSEDVLNRKRVPYTKFDGENGEDDVRSYFDSINRQGSFTEADSIEDLLGGDWTEMLTGSSTLFIPDEAGNVKAESY